MNTRTVNLDTYSLSLLTAKEDIFNPRSSTDWALFVYDGVSNKLKLADSGAGGVAELASKFHASKPQYGLCRMKGPDNASPRTALIIWVGQNVDDYRRTECANHVPAIKNFFKEAHVFLQAESAEEVTEERIRTELSKAHTNSSTQWLRRSSRSMDREDIVGTNYRKTNAAMEMRLLNRDSFWARAEREEEERKEEDRRKAAEERRRLERERAAKERQEADERDRRMNEKLKTIEEQRRKAAEQEEELRKQEKLKWEQQKREHEEEMRARLKRSESIEKAAEAAALVSQRTMNPREFFRQLSSSSSLSPTSPSRSGKPFRRYQRSLTDTAFIFSKAEESAASSPRSSPLVSPFSRAPPSPFNRAASPPTSPVFRASTSPQRAPLSPPLSPLRPAPPTSSLPNVPTANLQIKGRAQSPTGPSAPPASPTLLAPSAEGAPGSPSSLAERSAFTFEPSLSPPSSRASLPDQPISAAELASEISYKVQTVLVEEDEEEEEKEEENIKDEESEVTQSEPQADSQETKERNTFKSEPQTKEEEEEALEEEDVKEEERDTSPAPASAVEEQHQTAERSEENEGAQEPLDQTEDAEEALVAEEEEQRPREEGEAVGFETEEDAEQEESEEMITEEEHAHSDLSPHEPAPTQHEDALLITDPDPEESCEITRVTEELPIKLITNGNTQQHNGTDHSLSPSDPELDSPELAVYCTVEDDEEDDICIEKYIKISENGDEVLTEPQVCVRALYDYQAEDESELSFELGDIIRDVEAVDKGWWRGWSQDGRQGLFPANYVEPISPQ